MLIKVSARSKAVLVAGAIAGMIRDDGSVTLHAIGAGAVNQTVKAISVTQDYLDIDDIEILTKIEMVDTEIEGNVVTAVQFTVTNIAADDRPTLNE